MEEIDIIELLKRVKEGKAPSRIEIDGRVYTYNGYGKEYTSIDNALSYFEDNNNIFNMFDDKIIILDRPIIEELKVEEGHTDLGGLPYTVYPTKDEIIEKINEIIKHINNN